MFVLNAIVVAVMAWQVQAAGLVVPPLGPPTRTAPPTTAQEMAALREGIALYEQRRLDEAYAKFEAVYKANPDCTMALYEMGLVHFVKKEFQRAIDMAASATAYKDQPGQLAQYYSLIGNSLDAAREPRKAVEVYQKGLEVAPAVGLYYNMGVTQAQSLSDVPAARTSLKAGARLDPMHASTQLLLGKLFGLDSLQTPALFALSRFLILEPATARTSEAYQLWFRLLNGTLRMGADGKPTITVNPDQKKDEGDLTKLDLQISLSKIATAQSAETKSQIQAMADQLDALFGVYAVVEPGEDKNMFVYTYYMPYFTQMQKQGHVQPFVYYVSQRTNLPGVREWLTVNQDKVTAFLDWSRRFPFPAPTPAGK
jgi:tetratricopeptide (TPR) repeat protein